MSRWIDYDAIDYRNDKMIGKSSDFIDGVIYMAERIEEAPSIDIVRCNECKHITESWVWGEISPWMYEKITSLKCTVFELERDADDFCSGGERRK